MSASIAAVPVQWLLQGIEGTKSRAQLDYLRRLCVQMALKIAKVLPGCLFAVTISHRSACELLEVKCNIENTNRYVCLCRNSLM